ncbi:unnamed protein product [Ambrosiozyma monospora]|uniref:Unnamed protein product n=1 Tax=Ambrosiozyma monospora TaxID=43982 RepID=A0A9W7DGN5_AMBMO|nr:unnamed protein product [Ambrosiozyma monospora]
MGFIDCIYIVDDKDTPIFEHVLNTSTPTFNYLYTQLQAKRRHLAVQQSVDVFSSVDSVFDDSTAATLDYIIPIDSKWQIAWTKKNKLAYVLLSTSSPEYLEVYSDDEDDDDYHDENGEGEGNSESNKKVEKSTVRISNNVNPLQYFEFIDQFIEISKVFIGVDRLNAGRVKANGHKLMLILQEMVDGTVPLINDLNQLQELLPDDSIIKRILNTTKHLQNTAQSSISNIAQSQSIMPNARRGGSFGSQSSGVSGGMGNPSPATGTLTTSILEKSGYQQST